MLLDLGLLFYLRAYENPPVTLMISIDDLGFGAFDLIMLLETC